MLRTLAITLLVGSCAAAARAQDPHDRPRDGSALEALADSSAVVEQDGSLVLLPVLGYTPDTGLLLGGLALRFFHLEPPDEDARPSVISPVVVYTLKNQVMVFLGTDLNWGGNRWHAGLMPSYQKFPDDFYGIGRDTPVDPLESYTPEQFAFEGMIERRVAGDLRLGIGYQVAKHQLLETEPGGALAGGQVAGTGTSVLSAPGLLAGWDSRDNTWSPRRGLWLQTGLSFYRDAWGSDYHYTESFVDLRRYWPTGERSSLALQAVGRDIDGVAPFFRLPRLGGQNGLRGYAGGRFIDDTMVMVRTEWRTGPVWKRFGAVAFAGMGDVAPGVGDLTTAAGLTTWGLGLRWLVNTEEKVNVRMDFGFGKDDSGFYLSLGEAF